MVNFTPFISNLAAFVVEERAVEERVVEEPSASASTSTTAPLQPEEEVLAVEKPTIKKARKVAQKAAVTE
jgi:hypothetical protein